MGVQIDQPGQQGFARQFDDLRGARDAHRCGGSDRSDALTLDHHHPAGVRNTVIRREHPRRAKQHGRLCSARGGRRGEAKAGEDADRARYGAPQNRLDLDHNSIPVPNAPAWL